MRQGGSVSSGVVGRGMVSRLWEMNDEGGAGCSSRRVESLDCSATLQRALSYTCDACAPAPRRLRLTVSSLTIADKERAATYHPAPMTERPMLSATPVSAHAYGEVSSRKAPGLNWVPAGDANQHDWGATEQQHYEPEPVKMM